MQISYSFATADLTDLMQYARRRHADSYRWRAFRSAVITSLLTLAFYALTSGPPIVRIVGSLAFVVSVYLLLSQFWQIPTRRQYEAYLQRRLGSAGPFLFEIEISENYLRTRQLGENNYREWRCVTDVREANSGIYFDLLLGGSIFVRDSGFLSLDNRNEFLRSARQYMLASRHHTKPLPTEA